jgi:hypothetical protein
MGRAGRDPTVEMKQRGLEVLPVRIVFRSFPMFQRKHGHRTSAVFALGYPPDAGVPEAEVVSMPAPRGTMLATSMVAGSVPSLRSSAAVFAGAMK